MDGTCPEEICRAGGKKFPEPNYGFNCVIGWQKWEDGTESFAWNCIFCGHDFRQWLADTENPNSPERPQHPAQKATSQAPPRGKVE